MLVEDNPLDARLIREFLRQPALGCSSLTWVRTLDEGLAEVAKGDVALVLLDLFLPDGEGLQGLTRLRSRLNAPPVIVVTGMTEDTLAVDAMKAGAQDYLVKGHFDEGLLKRAIQYGIERHRLMDTLRTYEERYALAVQATNVGIWDWNPLTDEVFLSTRWKAILGYAEEEVPNDLAWVARAVHPEDLKIFHERIRPRLEKSEPQYDTDARLKHKSGEYRDMHIMGLLARDSAGHAYRMVGTMVDVTERKRMERALADEKERLAVTLRSIADGVIATDTHNRVRLINPVAQALTGWSWKDAEGRPLEEVFGVLDDEIASIWSVEGHQDEGEDAADLGNRAGRPGAAGRSGSRAAGSSSSQGAVHPATVDRVRTLVNRDGTERLVEVSYSAMHDQRGARVGAVYIICDVTDRKKAELARAHLAAIVESTDGAIFSKTLDGVITSWNAGAERMLGYTAAEAIGTKGDFLATEGATPGEAGGVGATQRVVQQAQSEYSEIRLLRKDMMPIEVALTRSLIRNPSGEVIGVSSIAHDITERKRNEKELKLYREQLEDLIQARTRELTVANRELEAFCYSVSHDLRAPLRSIDGFSQALKEDYKSQVDEQGQEYIERIHSATQRMAQLIDDLLNLSRVTRSELRISDVSLSEMAESIVTELRQIEPARTVAVTIDPGLKTHGDGTLLRALLQNLLGNAWKFTRNRKEATIEFRHGEHEGRATYWVRDNGAGFDMRYVKKLFTPFQRLHAVTEFEGTGIGLAITNRVVSRHGGQIWAVGAVDQGATVYFTLKHEAEKRSGSHE
ncbi:MAG: PAS domain S-box protein [Planctomycetota bacterium]